MGDMKKTWLVATIIVIAAGCARTDGQSRGQALAAAGREPAVATSSSAPPPPAAVRHATDGATASASAGAPKFREVTLPTGTVLPVTLSSPVGSDTSRVEDPVRATLRRPVMSNGAQVLPAGTAVLGHVTH